MQQVGNRVLHGSQTFGRQAARADLESQPGDPIDMAAELLDSSLNPQRIPARVLKAIPRKDRSVLGDPAANEMLARALSDPNEMTRLLNLMEIARSRRATPTARSVGAATLPLLPAQSLTTPRKPS